MHEALGPRIRRQRRRLGLTLDDLSARTGISKPYLSLIETGRVPNPPSDEKVRKLEVALSFKPNDLLTQAHLLRTPKDVRAMLAELMQGRSSVEVQVEATANHQAPGTTSHAGAERSIATASRSAAVEPRSVAPDPRSASAAATAIATAPSPFANRKSQIANAPSKLPPGKPGTKSESAFANAIDPAYLTGMLRQMIDVSGSNIDGAMRTHAVPIINKVSAGYPKDFTDMAYPNGVADTYVSCPDVSDPDAFAARVSGDSMTPKYREGDIVIFSPKASVVEGVDCFVRFEDGQTTFKRVFFESDDKGKDTIRLQPRNERYRPQVIPAEQITGLYRAVFKYQSVED